MYPSGFCQQILPALDWDKLQFFSFARRWNLPFSLPPPLLHCSSRSLRCHVCTLLPVCFSLCKPAVISSTVGQRCY